MSDRTGRVSQAESICIRTNKVYDWCFKNGTTSFVISDLVFPTDTAPVAGVDCELTAICCTETGRDQSGGGIAVVTLRKQATFRLTFVDAEGAPVPVVIGGTLVESQIRTRFFEEFIQICAPEGTDIVCEITDAGCRATLGEGIATVDIFICQSVQVEAEVKVCIDINDFCVPDLCEQVPKPFDCPPSQFFPPQCAPANPRFSSPCTGGSSPSSDQSDFDGDSSSGSCDCS